MIIYFTLFCLKLITQERLIVAGEANYKLEQFIRNFIYVGMFRISPEGRLRLLLLSRTLFRFSIQSEKITP